MRAGLEMRGGWIVVVLCCLAWIVGCSDDDGRALHASSTSPPIEDVASGDTREAPSPDAIEPVDDAMEEDATDGDIEPPPEDLEPPPEFVPSAQDMRVEANLSELRRMLPNEVTLELVLSSRAEAAVEAGDRFIWSIEGEAPEGRQAQLVHMGRRDLMVSARWARGEDWIAARELTIPMRPHALFEMPPSPPSIPAAPAEGLGSARIAIISDSNGSYGSPEQPGAVSSAVDALIAQGADLVIHCGDMVAGQSSGLSRAEVDAMWVGYHDVITDPLQAAGAQVIPVPGNHDADPSQTHDRPAYIAEWTARRPDVEFIDDAYFPMAYSFAFQGSFFLVIDGATGRLEADGALWGGEISQLEWIEAQLLAAQDYQYRFAFSHVPFTGFAQEIPGEPYEHGHLRDGDELFDVFLRMNLDVFFTAHYHVFFKGRYAGPTPSLHDGGELNVVATGRIGSGARYLIGQTERQSRAFVLLDLEDGLARDLFALERTDDGVYSRVFDDLWLSLQAGDYRRYDVPMP